MAGDSAVVCRCGETHADGDRFYVTASYEGAVRYLLGPYSAHKAALAAVDQGRDLAGVVDQHAGWYLFGVEVRPGDKPLPRVLFGDEALKLLRVLRFARTGGVGQCLADVPLSILRDLGVVTALGSEGITVTVRPQARKARVWAVFTNLAGKEHVVSSLALRNAAAVAIDSDYRR